ncbi:MAG: aminotransferase class V-fold PLP-dependent enzyme [Candidatus Faecousia sp.]|nr:aminotransferase class V-fold PLP-dependent enzyme [Clostridiales bacterium]MDY6180904.1 aminotransferase class V-fold PLP-dependent enzyme [Candidatus Faecousia sp.]
MASYIPSTLEERQEMLRTVGVSSFRELYRDVPAQMYLEQGLNLPDGMSELEVRRQVSAMAAKNHVFPTVLRGAGAYDHYIPSIVRYIPVKEEFLTAYTPYQAEMSQGILQSIFEYQTDICELTGMDVSNASVYDGATAAAEAAAMCGFQVVNIPSAPDGCVDLEALKAVLGEDTAGLMLTNPNTVGIFDENILEITRLVHEAGGLCCYDGANLNAVMGVVRPGDMGFDCVHLNLHKTFATPHGGGGPGAGAVGCKAHLADFLPKSALMDGGDHIQIRSFAGNFLVVVKALTYILTLGREGIPEAARNAVLNANYLMAKIKGTFEPAFDRICMHEFVLDLSRFKKETGVSALDVAKTLIDYGMHPPTMYFPMIVHEALMLEPTETESRETLDWAAEVFRQLYALAQEDPAYMHASPHHAQIGRPDEVQASRNPVVRYQP